MSRPEPTESADPTDAVERTAPDDGMPLAVKDSSDPGAETDFGIVDQDQSDN